MSLHDLLTHNGTLLYSDYLILFFAAIASTWLQVLQAQSKHKDKFHFKLMVEENLIRWVASFNIALFILYVAPDAYFWYMEQFTKTNEIGTTHWNSFFSAVVGFFPLQIIKKFVKVTKSKLRDNPLDENEN